MLKLLVLTVTCFFFLGSTLSDSSFLPTQYSPLGPVFYEAAEKINLQFDLCDSQLYEGCLFTAQINFPYSQWNVENGITVDYSIIGGKNCTNLYCSNDPKSSTPQNCSFFLPANNGPTLYYVSQSGLTAELSTTFVLKVDCGVTGNSTFGKYSKGCPFKAERTRKNVKITEPHSVITSPTDPVVFSFVVCPIKNTFSSFNYVLTATDQVSAFSSYFCMNSTCRSGPGVSWYDASASSLNTVSATQLTGTELAVAIYGWGAFNSTNNFVFDIQIENKT